MSLVIVTPFPNRAIGICRKIRRVADGKVGGAIRSSRPLAPPEWARGRVTLSFWLIPATERTTPQHREGSPLIPKARLWARHA